MKFKSQEPSLSPLQQALANLEAKNTQLGRIRNEFLLLESERKHFEAKLVLSSPGKSHAERTTHAQASVEWLVFHEKLARREAAYEYVKFQLTILDKVWQTAYLETKLDQGVIIKQE